MALQARFSETGRTDFRFADIKAGQSLLIYDMSKLNSARVRASQTNAKDPSKHFTVHNEGDRIRIVRQK